MTGLRATPQRGSYRVYTEEEFFASDGPLASAGTAAPARVPCAAPPACGRRAPVGARVVWCALLGVAVAAVAGVVARDAVRSRAGGRLLADGEVVPHPPRAARSAPVAARASFGGAVRRRSARRALSPLSRAARRRTLPPGVPPVRPHGPPAAGVAVVPATATASASSPTILAAPDPAPPAGSHTTPATSVPAPPAASPTITAAPAPPAASPTITAAPAPAPATTAATATATARATAATAHGARAEFGFER